MLKKSILDTIKYIAIILLCPVVTASFANAKQLALYEPVYFEPSSYRKEYPFGHVDPCLFRLIRGDIPYEKLSRGREIVYHPIDRDIFAIPPDDIYVYNINNDDEYIDADIPLCIESFIEEEAYMDNYPVITLTDLDSGAIYNEIFKKDEIDNLRKFAREKDYSPSFSVLLAKGDEGSFSEYISMPSLTKYMKIPLKNARYSISMRVGDVVSSNFLMNIHILSGKKEIFGISADTMQIMQYPFEKSNIRPISYSNIKNEYYFGDANDCSKIVDISLSEFDGVKINMPELLIVDDVEDKNKRFVHPIPLCGSINMRKRYDYSSSNEKYRIHIVDLQTGKLESSKIYIKSEGKELPEHSFKKTYHELSETPLLFQKPWFAYFSTSDPRQYTEVRFGGYFVINISRQAYLPRRSGEYLIWVSFDGVLSEPLGLSIQFAK